MIVWMLTSLFLAPEDCEVQEDKEATIAQELPEESKPPPSDLVLQGILSLPDTQNWIVWINGVRIDSRRPQSIMGWRVVSVHEDHVVITSSHGGQKELWLQQDQDQDDMIPPAPATDTESPQDAVLEADDHPHHEQPHDAPHEESKEVSQESAQESSQGTRSKDQREGNKEGRTERHGGSRENIVSATHKGSTDSGHIPTQQPSDAPKERSLFSPPSPPSSPPVKEEAPFVSSSPPPSAQFSRQP